MTERAPRTRELDEELWEEAIQLAADTQQVFRLRMNRIMVAWQRVFPSENMTDDQRIVLEELRAFAQPDQPTFYKEPADDPHGRGQARNEGRRECWLHVDSRRNLTPQHIEELTRAYLKATTGDDEV